MTRIALRTLLLAAALACTALPAAAQTAPAAPPRNEALRQELLRMYEADQAVRQRFFGEAMRDEALGREMIALDAAHTKRLREIFEAHGFPGVPLVGKEAAQAVVTMVVHGPSLELKKQALAPLLEAARRGEVPMSAYAGLLDTVLRNEGQPQVYGTRFESVGGKLVLAPTRDLKGLAARRRKVGLMPMAEYVKGLGEMYKVPVVAEGVPR
ncbi:MAG TPA: DUF6624 domain-containing protein [Pyrinomonadaceae bacterium]|nr:DUF6624 domain-containing protein [Pyrinomonadaceae bacterium]